jgi:hypothetical protein
MSAWKLVEAVEEVRQADTNTNGFSEKRGGRGGRGEKLIVQIKNTKNSAFVICKILEEKCHASRETLAFVFYFFGKLELFQHRTESFLLQ